MSATTMPKLILEPSTLVYTLTDTRFLSFQQFYLIVRGLHIINVENITPFPEKNSVHVKLRYQASVANAQKKLGSLANYVIISKLSNFVNECEYAELNALRAHFGIGGAATSTAAVVQPFTPPQPVAPTTATKRGGKRIFGTRSAPYKPRKVKAPSAPEEDEVQYIEVPDTQECAVTTYSIQPQNDTSGYYISDPAENQEQVSE